MDPESAALHVNGTALLQHKHADSIERLVEKFFSEGPRRTLAGLMAANESGERVTLANVYTSLLHEMRHYVDLLLTPHGFNRLRVAFECYFSMISFLLNKDVTQIPIPLISGYDPIIRRMLKLRDYEGSVADHYSQFILGRFDVIANGNGLFGGDAIMEALAFSVQLEVAQTIFPGTAYRAKMPYLYNTEQGVLSPRSEAFNLKYRWHYGMAHDLDSQPDANTILLVYWILYASLCGSYSEGANYQFLNPMNRDLLHQPKTERNVSEKLPNNRLAKLFRYFRDHPSLVKSDNPYGEVDTACQLLFGKSVVTEIGADVNSDVELLHIYESRYGPSADAYTHTALGAFKDLVMRRQQAFALFKEKPERFVHPVRFVETISELPMPNVIYNLPHGASTEEFPNNEWRILTDQTYPILSDAEPKTTNVVYSVLRTFSSQPKEGRESWINVLSLFCPAYKAFLYGFKYRSMLEFDVVKILELDLFKEKIVWDLFYKRASDISDADEYFSFYDLDSARCDVCSQAMTRNGCKYVSALTVRQCEPLMNHFDTMNPQLSGALTIRDWTGWLLCRSCGTRFSLF